MLENAYWRSCIMGLLCCPVGIVIGLLLYTSEDVWKKYFFAYTGMAAFITSALFWYFFVERKNSHSLKRAIIVGSLSGFLAHYTCWYLIILSLNFDYWVLGGPGSSLGEPPIDPLSATAGAWVYCLFSWYLFGWITVPAGGIIGGFYQWFLQNKKG